MKPKLFKAIGLMSGTSIDGIDAALVETDGLDYVRPIAFMPAPYEQAFRTRLRGAFGNKEGARDPAVAAVERELTQLHGKAVHKFLQQLDGVASDIDLIGFHGQTIWHQPKKQTTIQIGDGALLASLTGIPVVNDFRSADVQAGGNGAPLVPLYHRALAAGLPKPIAILNIGGVSNMTWIGGDAESQIMACDVGPGNAMIDDWVLAHTGEAFDQKGLLAAAGHVDGDLVEKVMARPFFRQKPPKSIDRNMFKKLMPDQLNAADGAATLTMIAARAIARGLRFMPQAPTKLYITGGGRLNNTLMRWIGDLTEIPVSTVDELGWRGDALEAEAFAYLAVRSHLGLPLSMPGTTGVPMPMTGGTLHRPDPAVRVLRG